MNTFLNIIRGTSLNYVLIMSIKLPLREIKPHKIFYTLSHKKSRYWAGVNY